MKKRLLAMSLVGATLLSGCLIPEKFTAKIQVQHDGSYTFQYAGTAANAFAALQLKQEGTLSSKDENSLKADAEKMAKSPEIQRAVYQGKGRYELKIESKKKSGESLTMFDVFKVSTDKAGVMTIASSEIKDKDKQELAQMGIKMDGVLEVSLPKNAEVISQNAQSTPSFFGMFGAYTWKIGSVDQRPVMKIKLKP